MLSLPTSLPRAGAVTLAIVLASSPAALATDGGTFPHARLRDGSHDAIVARAYLPSDGNRHGEARLVRRGDAWCLQTLIYSRALRRGVQRMRKKELYYWPEDQPGHEDSARYLEDLESSKLHVLELFEQRTDPSDNRKRMLIELVLAPEASFYAFYEVDIEEVDGEQVIRRKEPILVREASRTYVTRALRIQAETAFGAVPPELEGLGS